MSTMILSLKQRIQSGMNALKNYPLTMLFALLFSMVTAVRIQMDWPQQQDYNFLLTCLHLTFAMAGMLNLMLMTLNSVRFGSKRSCYIMNLLTLLGAAIAFVYLYGFSAFTYTDQTMEYVAPVASSRIGVTIFISILLFVYFAGNANDSIDFSGALFMTQKSLVIALIYGLALMGGTSAVAGAIEALLYKNMSSKVYMYLGTISGLVAFSLFVGYFPDFAKKTDEERWESVQKQPRFIEILIEMIAVPIVLALTVVLFLWIGKTVVTGIWPSFSSVLGILSWYAIVGVWLFFLNRHLEKGVGKMYRYLYPISLFLIMIFGIIAFFKRIEQFGLKNEEYIFLIMIFDSLLIGGLLLKWIKKAIRPLVLVLIFSVVISVLPGVGYYDLPPKMQISRLEQMLTESGILQDNTLIPVVTGPSKELRIKITESVNYLANLQNHQLPTWFDRALNNPTEFEKRLGFEQTYEYTDAFSVPQDSNLYTSMNLGSGPLDISGYTYAVYFHDAQSGNPASSVTVQGANGSYVIEWIYDQSSAVPTIRVLKDDTVVIEENLSSSFDKLKSEGTGTMGNGGKEQVFDPPTNMTVNLHSDSLEILILFDFMSFNIDPQRDTIDYYFNVNAVFLKEL